MRDYHGNTSYRTPLRGKAFTIKFPFVVRHKLVHHLLNVKHAFFFLLRPFQIGQPGRFLHLFTWFIAWCFLLFPKVKLGFPLLVCLVLAENFGVVNHSPKALLLVMANVAGGFRRVVGFYNKHATFLYAASLTVEGLPFKVPRRVTKCAHLALVPQNFAFALETKLPKCGLEGGQAMLV